MNPEEQIKSKSDFYNINNSYILQIIFDFLEKNKFLKIIKPNKEIQKRLNININNYKEFSELYTPIEIEFGKFFVIVYININNYKEFSEFYFDRRI